MQKQCEWQVKQIAMKRRGEKEEGGCERGRRGPRWTDERGGGRGDHGSRERTQAVMLPWLTDSATETEKESGRGVAPLAAAGVRRACGLSSERRTLADRGHCPCAATRRTAGAAGRSDKYCPSSEGQLRQRRRWGSARSGCSIDIGRGEDHARRRQRVHGDTHPPSPPPASLGTDGLST